MIGDVTNTDGSTKESQSCHEKKPKLRKLYFNTDTPNGPSKGFQRYGYQLLGFGKCDFVCFATQSNKPFALFTHTFILVSYALGRVTKVLAAVSVPFLAAKCLSLLRQHADHRCTHRCSYVEWNSVIFAAIASWFQALPQLCYIFPGFVHDLYWLHGSFPPFLPIS